MKANNLLTKTQIITNNLTALPFPCFDNQEKKEKK